MDEEYYLPISAIEHFSYCQRQCALIHVERTFDENVHTLRGTATHRNVDIEHSDVQEGVRTEYALPVVSHSLKVIGKCDSVEFSNSQAPYPVEYKHGSRRDKLHDDLQLVTQSLCLEEMFGLEINKGAIYYFSSRRRREVLISQELRELTKKTIIDARALIISRTVPKAEFNQRCINCSLMDLCQPRNTGLPILSKSTIAQLYSIED